MPRPSRPLRRRPGGAAGAGQVGPANQGRGDGRVRPGHSRREVKGEIQTKMKVRNTSKGSIALLVGRRDLVQQQARDRLERDLPPQETAQPGRNHRVHDQLAREARSGWPEHADVQARQRDGQAARRSRSCPERESNRGTACCRPRRGRRIDGHGRSSISPSARSSSTRPRRPRKRAACIRADRRSARAHARGGRAVSTDRTDSKRRTGRAAGPSGRSCTTSPTATSTPTAATSWR